MRRRDSDVTAASIVCIGKGVVVVGGGRTHAIRRALRAGLRKRGFAGYRSTTEARQSPMRRWTAWCAVALLALPGPLWGQEARVDRIREAFPAEAAERIEAVVGEAAAMGVPTEPLFDKALEGAAKRVPSDRVVAAVSEYAGRLQRATQLIGGAPDVGVVVAGADALRRGVSPDALRNVGGQAGARTPAALVVLGDLVESGVPVDRALEAVREALSDRHEPGALNDIPAALRRLIRDGHIPADAIQRIRDGMRRGLDPRRIDLRRPPGDFSRTDGPPLPPGSDPPPDRVRRFRRPPGGAS